MAEIVDFGLQKHKIKMDSRYFDNVLSVVAGDTGRRIEVQLLDTNGMVQNTTGLNLRLNAVVEGKATYTDATITDAATGKYQLDLSNGMFLAPGDWQFQWQVTDSAGKKLHSFLFTGNVGKNISEGGSQATNFYLSADELREKAVELEDRFQEMYDEIANKDIISAPEIIAARNGETDLNARLTKNEQNTAAQLTKKQIQLTEIDKFKMDKNTTDISVSQLNKNKGKLDQTYMSVEFLEQIAGNAPIGPVPVISSIDTSKLSNGAVTREVTDFLKVASSNLFDYDKRSKNSSLDGSNGSIIANIYHDVTDYIPVTPNLTYIANGISKIAFYKKDKTFISLSEQATPNESFKVISDAYYIRLAVSNILINNKEARMNIGNELLAMDDYSVEIDKLNTESDRIKNLSVSSEQTDFIEVVSNNILNNKDFTKNSTFHNLTGVVSESVGNNLSNFTDAKPNTIYSKKDIVKVGFFDKDYKILSVVGSVETNFTTPDKTKYLRSVFSKKTAQINKGNVLKEYDDYSITIKGVEISTVDSRHKEYDEFIKDNMYVVDGKVDGVYASQPLEPVVGLADYTSTEMFALIDDLATRFPEYITKSLGGMDGQGSEIPRYDLVPQDVKNVDDNAKIPKMILVGGIHGNEKTGVYNLYLTMKAICEGWKENENLEALRWNVHFIILPIVNIFGFNGGHYRKNENGVDLARNFPTGWRLGLPEDVTYGGAMPLSEKGSQVVNTILSENSDAIYFGSLHNFFEPLEPGYFIWNASATKMQVNLCKKLVSKMGRKWAKDYTWLSDDIITKVGYATDGAPMGSESMHASSYGIHSGTFEICERFDAEPSGIVNSSVATTAGVETLVNWLILNLKNNTDYYNHNKRVD